jgi:hypothetical protein
LRITELPLGGGISQLDAAFFVGDQDRLRRGLQQRADHEFALLRACGRTLLKFLDLVDVDESQQ